MAKMVNFNFRNTFFHKIEFNDYHLFISSEFNFILIINFYFRKLYFSYEIHYISIVKTPAMLNASKNFICTEMGPSQWNMYFWSLKSILRVSSIFRWPVLSNERYIIKNRQKICKIGKFLKTIADWAYFWHSNFWYLGPLITILKTDF